MAKEKKKQETKTSHVDGAMPEQAAQGVFRLKNQYISDLSFECPQSPSFLGEYKNNINLDVGVQTNRIGGENSSDYEISLVIRGRNETDDKKVVYLLEMKFSGLFTLENIPDNDRDMLLGIDAPALLYPYARQIFMSTITASGFQPPLLEPINFGALYMQALQNKQQEAAAAQTSAS